jgi:hypothetical protein
LWPLVKRIHVANKTNERIETIHALQVCTAVRFDNFPKERNLLASFQICLDGVHVKTDPVVPVRNSRSRSCNPAAKNHWQKPIVRDLNNERTAREGNAGRPKWMNRRLSVNARLSFRMLSE